MISAAPCPTSPECLIELFPEAGDRTMSWRELETAMQGGASMPARLIRAARPA